MQKTTFEDEIARTGKLVYKNKGVSMMPLLRQNRDLMVIEKPNGRLKKYDAPLYKRQSGDYVLHRVLQVRPNDYVICGDNCINREYGITDEQIIGVLTAVIRDGKEIPVTNPGYLLYVHLWCDFFWIRVGILRVLNLCKRCVKKIIKMKPNR